MVESDTFGNFFLISSLLNISLSLYITSASEKDFQPMNSNFGILEELDIPHKKANRKELFRDRAFKDFELELKKINEE